MAKYSKADIIKKIIDLNPEDPGSLTEQYITKKNGKKLGPYWIFQTSSAGNKVSIRVPKNEVEEVDDYISKMKQKNKIHVKKATSLLDTYMDAISDISPGHVPPTKDK
jgi:hypothetical protein